jgi:heme exporter protein D
MQQWSSLQDFLHMGGHGFFVWGSYAVTFGLLAAEAVFAVQRHRRARAEASRAQEE